MNEAIAAKDGTIKLLTIIAVLLAVAFLGAVVWAFKK